VTGAPWHNRIVDHANVAPADLVPNPRNWRTHPAEQQRALSGALSEVGWVTGVVVNRTTGNVVDGHLRIELAVARQEPTVPVTYVELTEAEEALVLATLDPIGAMANAEATALASLLDGLEPADEALRALLDDLTREQGIDLVRTGLVDPDDAPDLAEEPTVGRGELYALGDHRLLCGDATNEANVRRVFGEATEADLIWTDPPYGVAYQTKLSTEEAVARHRRTDGLEVAKDQPEDIPALLSATFGLAPLRAGGAFYVASPSSGDVLPIFYAALAGAGMAVRQQLIWVKDVFVMGRHDFHYRHEPILYGWKEGAAHFFGGGRAQDTVWEIPRPRRSETHPTMKPVELVARALTNSSRPGDLVYEPFAGSGSTIVAAEQTRRRCVALEIDPRYAQVAMERWEASRAARRSGSMVELAGAPFRHHELMVSPGHRTPSRRSSISTS
jgi:DNA modification methylase